MAIVEYASPISAIRGSIGGWTFQRTNAGNIIRLRGSKYKSSTGKQTESHQQLQKQINSWQQLTLGEQQLWDLFATAHTKTSKLGTEKTLNGFNWFTSINTNLELIGEPKVSTPPVYAAPEAVQSFNLTVDATKIELDFGSAWNPANTNYLLYATYPTSQTTNLKLSALKLIDVIDTFPVTTLDVTSPWEIGIDMTYPPPGTDVCYSIGVFLVPIEKSSGVGGAGLGVVGNTSPGGGGIGVMVIGSTFIVG